MTNRTSYFYDPDVGNFHYGESGCRSEQPCEENGAN